MTALTVIALPLKHTLTLPPVVSKLQIVPCSSRQTAGPEWLKYWELFKTKGSMPQRYFRNMLLHSEKCSWIIICMLEAVYFLSSVYYYFWKILPWIWNQMFTSGQCFGYQKRLAALGRGGGEKKKMFEGIKDKFYQGSEAFSFPLPLNAYTE